MKTPIDFGKEFLYRLYDQRDADACQKMLAGDLVWITPEDMHHFLSEGAVLKYLRKQVKTEEESRYVDLISIKSSPSADNIMTVAYEVNLVSREEEQPLYLRCSMVICRRSKRLEITFLHFSKKTERDSSEQLRDFITNLPCGVMILACLDGRREEAIFYNDYFANRLRYKQEEFALSMARNPFFMTSEEDRVRVHEQIDEARRNGGSISANLRFYRRDGNSFNYKMKGTPAYQADGGTVYYCVFQETTGFQMTADRLQSRLDSVTEIVRQVPEAICGIEYPPYMLPGKAEAGSSAQASSGTSAQGSSGTSVQASSGDAAGASSGASADAAGKGEKSGSADGDGDVKIYRGRRKGSRAAEKTAAARTSAVKITRTGPKVFFTSKNIPSMFGVSNSVYMKNILQDPFYGLEITSITRERLMSSFILDPDKAAVGKAVSCGIFRVKTPDQSDEQSVRVELMIRRVKDKDGTMRLYLFYYDREAAQQDLENRVDRAMKMGRAGQEQLRLDLRKARENTDRRISEMTSAMKKAEEKHAADLTRVENNLAEEKKRGVLMGRQLEEAKGALKQITTERDRIEEDASRRIRNYEARAQRQVKEACNARDLLEEQLREAQERARTIEQQLNREKARRLLLEEQYRQLQEQYDELQKEQEDGDGAAPIKIAESMNAVMLSADVSRPADAILPAETVQSAAGAAAGGTGGAGRTGTLVSSVPETGSADSAQRLVPGAAPGPGAVSAAGAFAVTDTLCRDRKTRGNPSSAGIREGDWMMQNESLTVFSSMDPVDPVSDRKQESRKQESRDQESREQEGRKQESRESRPAEKKKTGAGQKGAPGKVQFRSLTERDADESAENALYEGDALLEETFSPEDFLDKIVSSEEKACAEKKIRLRLLKDSTLPATVIGFKALLRHALCEIIENGIVRARTGGSISIHCRADRPSGGFVNLYFRIEDNGKDISAAGMQTIFEEDHKADAGSRIPSGLSAAQEAAALMGGSIYAQSRQGTTRFSLTVALRV